MATSRTNKKGGTKNGKRKPARRAQDTTGTLPGVGMPAPMGENMMPSSPPQTTRRRQGKRGA